METLKTLFGLVIFIFCIVRFNSIVEFLSNFVVFWNWKAVDFYRWLKRGRKRVFNLYGVRVYTGRQGSGKTTALVERLNYLHKRFPDCHIYTNFDYSGATGQLESLNDLLLYRNGQNGVIFALDEIQNEFSSLKSKDFPETLLSTITMQRKQRILILCTSQVFTRMAKPLREQCFQVLECRTFFGRWTRVRGYDADDYNMIIDSPTPEKKFKLHKNYRHSFIQSDNLRDCFDTLEVIDRLSRQGFKPKVDL